MTDITNNKGEEYVGSNEIYAEVQRTMQQAAIMNTGWHSEEEVWQFLRSITGHDVPDDVRVFTPLHINYGPGVRFGRDCFLNFGYRPLCGLRPLRRCMPRGQHRRGRKSHDGRRLHLTPVRTRLWKWAANPPRKSTNTVTPKWN